MIEMRFRYDQLAKQLLRALLESVGVTTTSEEVLADSQHIDIWHLPGERVSPDGRARLGMLGRMTERACMLEPYHAPPDDDEVRDCVRKHLSFHHTRRLEARAAPDGPRMVPLATCWIVSSGRPGFAMPAFGFAQAEGWPSGTYDSVPGLQLKLAVLTELPRSRDTLFVRLLGRGAVLNRALQDLLALPPDSWERAVALPVFARLRFELPHDPADRTDEEEELAMNSQEIVEALQREATERGVAQGMAKGAADYAAHHVERRLGRKLREDERARISERIETLGPERVGDLVLDLSVDELAAWLADPNAR